MTHSKYKTLTAKIFLIINVFLLSCLNSFCSDIKNLSNNELRSLIVTNELNYRRIVTTTMTETSSILLSAPVKTGLSSFTYEPLTDARLTRSAEVSGSLVMEEACKIELFNRKELQLEWIKGCVHNSK